jgi:ribose transport system permease protein
LFIFFYSQSPQVFLKPANLAVIMPFIAIFGMLSIGEVLIIITGGIDRSMGSLTALTGVIVATLIIKVFGALQTLGVVTSILIVLVLGILIGCWHGFFVTKLKIPPFIITLGTWLIAGGLAAFITRGYPIVFPSEHPFLVLGQGSFFNIPISFIILIVLAVIVSIILSFTSPGYRIYAVGGNIEASRLSGINVERVRIFCYGASGFMASMTGILLASRLGQGTPTVGAAYPQADHDQQQENQTDNYNDTLLIHSALEKGEFFGGSEWPYRFSGHETGDTSETIL